MAFEKDNLGVNIACLSKLFSENLVIQYLFTEVNSRSRSRSFGQYFTVVHWRNKHLHSQSHCIAIAVLT